MHGHHDEWLPPVDVRRIQEIESAKELNPLGPEKYVMNNTQDVRAIFSFTGC